MSKVRQKTIEVLTMAKDVIGGRSATVSISGSAGLGIAKAAGLEFVQEVFATGEAVKRWDDSIDIVIELGGEDAKILFLTGGLEERMNGSCAGGTGAFIDQMAMLLGVSLEELDTLSLGHNKIYPIASRCGVFAKSDIQPLLNQDADKADIAASIFQAVVDQTITGLAQGRRLEGKIAFLGGPLYFFHGLPRTVCGHAGIGCGTCCFPRTQPICGCLRRGNVVRFKCRNFFLPRTAFAAGKPPRINLLFATKIRRYLPQKRNMKHFAHGMPKLLCNRQTHIAITVAPILALTAAAPQPNWC